MMDFVSSLDALVWIVGALIGLALVILLYARQVWAHRREFGYNVYTADNMRQRLNRIAGIAFVALLGIVAVVTWRVYNAANVPVINTGLEPTPVPEVVQLVIPRLEVQTDIIEAPIVNNEWDISALTFEVAHLAGTALPGEPGNSVLAGHITVPDAGWGPFHELETLAAGDEVFLLRGHHQLRYEVVETRVITPTDIEIAYPTDDTRLTLLTCTDWDPMLETYARRLAVIAVLVDERE